MDERDPRDGGRVRLRAALIVALLLGATLAAFTPAYQQNDDVVMTMIASGRGLSLQPDAHLVYVNVLLGELLRRAYGWAPALPFYGLLLIAVLAATQIALLHALLVRRGGAAAAFLVYFVTVASVFVVRLQFTAVAGLAAGVGLALWIADLDAGKRGERARRGGAALLVAAALVLVGSLLRFQALLLALVVASPLVLAQLARLDRRQVVLALRWPAAVLVVALALHLWDRASYEADPGWREFGELNAWRARIVDYGAGGDSPDLGRGAGWSANDALMLRRWFYADRAVFPVEKMRALVGAAPVARPDVAEAWVRIRDAFAYPSLLPMALALPLLVARRSARSRLRTLALALVPAVIVVVFLAVFLRAPEHIGMPALAFAPTVLLVAGDLDGERPGRRWRWPAIVLAAAAVTLASWQSRADGATAAEDNRDLRASLAMLSPRPQQLYVDWAGAFPYEAVLPLERHSYLSGLRLYSLGWPQRSPIADRMLQAHGIDDLFRSLYDRPDVFLLMNPSWRDSLEAYGRERYGVSLRLPERLLTPSFPVFQVERTDPPDPPASPSPAASRG